MGKRSGFTTLRRYQLQAFSPLTMACDARAERLASAQDEATLYFDGGLFFTSASGTASSRVWVTDGTSGGTKTTYVGDDPGKPNYLAAVGDNVVFNWEDASGDEELWVSDGSTAGTKRLKDIHPTGSSSPDQLVRSEALGLVFFRAQDSDSDEELWKTDGTVDGTVRVIDAEPGTGGSNALPFGDFGSLFLFSPLTTEHGREYWLTDGTSAGSQLLKDIRAEGHGVAVTPGVLGAVGDILIFSANDGTTGIEMWRSDGTAEGTFLLKDINPSGNGVRRP